MRLVCLSVILLALLACNEEPKPIDYGIIEFNGNRPRSVSVDSAPSVESVKALLKRVELVYPSMPEDSMQVTILEFQGDVYALDYYMNSGRFQGSTPILRGSRLEQSMRSGERIFIFRHDSFRRFERVELERFIRSLSFYKGGFPQEFLSLPFENRESGSTSVQTHDFLGVKSCFPVLVQSYFDGNLRWNVARSWNQVDESDYKAWVQHLKKVSPRGIQRNSDVDYFDAGAGTVGMSTFLPGGRVAIVWGHLGWIDLERKFFVASDRIYEARF